MKRDMNLVRNILLAIESEESSLDNLKLNRALEKLYTGDAKRPIRKAIAEHIQIMEEAGLVSVKIIRAMNADPAFLNLRMTSDGHDFLSNARDPSIWEKALPKIEGMSIAVATQVLIKLVKESVFGS